MLVRREHRGHRVRPQWLRRGLRRQRRRDLRWVIELEWGTVHILHHVFAFVRYVGMSFLALLFRFCDDSLCTRIDVGPAWRAARVQSLRYSLVHV